MGLMLRFYCKKTCRTCQKARAWLDERGVAYAFMDYTKTPPPEALIDALLNEYGADALRKRHKRYKELKDRDLATWKAAILEDPNLLIRPILVFDDGHYLAGFQPELWEAELKARGLL